MTRATVYVTNERKHHSHTMVSVINCVFHSAMITYAYYSNNASFSKTIVT